MKVICIDNKGVERGLTLGAIYEVLIEIEDPLNIYDNIYNIIDNDNDEYDYYKRRFKPYNPIDKLKALINS